ncbi:hypothetical protein ACVIKP_003612 [Rhizobium leguminosarum]
MSLSIWIGWSLESFMPDIVVDCAPAPEAVRMRANAPATNAMPVLQVEMRQSFVMDDPAG